MASLPAPVRVSPLIKASRWSLLLLGVMWGASRQRSLTKKENAIREYEAKQKVIRDAKKAVEKNRANRNERRQENVREQCSFQDCSATDAEMLYLAKESGVKVPTDFDEKFPPV